MSRLMKPCGATARAAVAGRFAAAPAFAWGVGPGWGWGPGGAILLECERTCGWVPFASGVPSGAAGDPGLGARTLLLRCGLRTPAVRVREKPIESSQRQEQSAKAE